MEKGLEPTKILPQTQHPLNHLNKILSELSTHEHDLDLQLVDLKEDQILLTEGDAGDSMYVIISGILGVRIHFQDGKEAVIDRLEPGAIVGEMALMSGQPRTATVYALTSAKVIRLIETHEALPVDRCARNRPLVQNRCVITQVPVIECN